jgi:hypothetical protein
MPPDMVVTVKKVGDRLMSETPDIQDELFPESETEFFIKEHYGRMTFVRDEQGRVSHFIYREQDVEVRADKIR